jgi:hypothetical protein
MYFTPPIRMTLILIGFTLLTGCAPAHVAVPEATEINTVAASGGLQQCQSELKTLESYHHQRFQRQNAAMSNLLSSSAQYLLLRSDLSADMLPVLDSIYQAQLARLCQQIHVDLFQAMIAQADEA